MAISGTDSARLVMKMVMKTTNTATNAGPARDQFMEEPGETDSAIDRPSALAESFSRPLILRISMVKIRQSPPPILGGRPRSPYARSDGM